MTREIKLTQGKVMLVSDDDYEEMSKHKWQAHQNHGNWYAVRGVWNGRGMTTVYSHHLILPMKGGLMVDHINGDGLDNRKENLRLVNCRVNTLNSSARRANKVRGTHLNNSNKSRPWQSRIMVSGKAISLGYYSTETEAHEVYKLACWLYGV